MKRLNKLVAAATVTAAAVLPMQSADAFWWGGPWEAMTGPMYSMTGYPGAWGYPGWGYPGWGYPGWGYPAWGYPTYGWGYPGFPYEAASAAEAPAEPSTAQDK